MSESYYEKNKIKIIERNKQYYYDNRDKQLQRSKQYYHNNKCKINEKNKRYYRDVYYPKNKYTLLVKQKFGKILYNNEESSNSKLNNEKFKIYF